MIASHGADVASAGIKTLIYGELSDSLTSRAIQSFGVERGTSNAIDNSLGLMFTLGSSFAFRALGSANSIGLGYKSESMISFGHNAVKVETPAGVSWSHLVKDELNNARYLGRGVKFDKSYKVATVKIGDKQASAAVEFMNSSNSNVYAGIYSIPCNNCATYSAEILKKAGIGTFPFIKTPSLNYLSVYLQSDKFKNFTAISSLSSHFLSEKIAPGVSESSVVGKSVSNSKNKNGSEMTRKNNAEPFFGY